MFRGCERRYDDRNKERRKRNASRRTLRNREGQAPLYRKGQELTGAPKDGPGRRRSQTRESDEWKQCGGQSGCHEHEEQLGVGRGRERADREQGGLSGGGRKEHQQSQAKPCAQQQPANPPHAREQPTGHVGGTWQEAWRSRGIHGCSQAPECEWCRRGEGRHG